jgi:hypothetical protein
MYTDLTDNIHKYMYIYIKLPNVSMIYIYI